MLIKAIPLAVTNGTANQSSGAIVWKSNAPEKYDLILMDLELHSDNASWGFTVVVKIGGYASDPINVLKGNIIPLHPKQFLKASSDGGITVEIVGSNLSGANANVELIGFCKEIKKTKEEKDRIEERKSSSRG